MQISTPEAWAFKQTMPAATHFMLQASELGLASLPMEGFDESRVRRALKIPRRYSLPVIIAVGYPTAKAAAAARTGRFPIGEMFSADVFGAQWAPA
mmetsp:Transcript_27846/g.64027  ORF Transcript_27846/g.64027 Transcript_27846/m.64027 type:complete len:96 (+) Transcript_27846:134-421(+)